MNTAQLQELITKIKKQASAHQASTAELKLNAYKLSENIKTFSKRLNNAEQQFLTLTTGQQPTATIMYLAHTELQLTGS